MTDRKEHWERIYSARSPVEVSWYQTEPVLSLQLIQNCGLQKNDPIIDVGGGASVLVDRLLGKGYRRLAVLDISSTSLAYAQQRLGDRARQVEWFTADVTEFVAPHPFSLWHDRAVFHFLTLPEDRKKYVEVLKKTLKPGGFLVLATFAMHGPTKCSGLDVVRYDAGKLMNELGDQFDLVGETGETHVTPDNKEQLFSWFHLVRKACR